MSFFDWLTGFLQSIPPQGVALALGMTSVLLVLLANRALAFLLLLAQYALVALLMRSQFLPTVSLVRLTQGLAVCLILAISAAHLQEVDQPQGVYSGLILRLIAIIVSGSLAQGLAHAYSLSILPAEINLASYWLMCNGLLLLLIGTNPLQIGLGILLLLSGFDMIYLSLDDSLLVTGLLGIAEVLVALAVAFYTENWITLHKGEVATS